MSLLKDLIKEMAVTGAGAIAGDRGTLFGGGAVDAKAQERRKLKMLRRIGYVKVDEIAKVKQSNSWKNVFEVDATFDQTDVISKLDAAEKRAKADKDTVAFGLEDEDGKIIKVYIRSEQADDFEAALATMLAGADEDEDEENSATEIAEVLFNLKDKFEIVDVEWGMIEGDEEQEQEIDGEDGELEDPEGELGDEELGDDSGDDEMVADDEMDDESEAKSALQSVIDVMKADAEAKTAEAKAREAEADEKTAKHSADAAAAKVQQEEEILDMEAHEKAKSDADKEAKTLAKLAKYKHETQDGDAGVSENEENEESSECDRRLSKEELAELILKHMAHN